MDRFEILSKLGEGSYSVVFKVRRKADSKIYALKKVRLKKLSEKEKKNALNEVRILASIKSTFVVSYKEAFIDEEESSLCIVMEYADKGDLYQKITHFKRMGYYFDEMDIWKVFIQMVKGLKALHDLKILHRDLKSANIFLFSDGSAKIGDLNVSKVAKKGIGYTQTGTPYYASPEVWRDEPYDSKSDIWSLACVTYEMLTLHPPFRAENMKGLYEKVLKGKYPKINDRYSSDISDLLKLLFSINPKERPSCDEILQNKIVIKRLDFLKSGGESNDNPDLISMNENSLLRTIRLPRNIIFLSNKLPKANYDSISDINISTAENTKEITNNYSIHKLPSIKKLNHRYKKLSTEDNKSNKEIKVNNLNIITEASNKNINLNNNDNSNNNNNEPGIPQKRNISLSPSLKLPIGHNKINNILNNQRQRIANMPISIKNDRYNRGRSELYRLYISNDYKIPKLRNDNNIGLYLPNVFIRKNNGKKHNNISISNASSNVNSKKRLSPLNIKK